MTGNCTKTGSTDHPRNVDDLRRELLVRLTRMHCPDPERCRRARCRSAKRCALLVKALREHDADVAAKAAKTGVR